MRPLEKSGRGRRRRRQGGFTLVELCITLVIVCLMTVMAMPTFRKAIEQARVDVASANLRTIWAAQRVYWLEQRRYASTLSDLRSMDLIDAAVAASGSNPKAVYAYRISSADASTFVAAALRNGSAVWSGQLQINQEGTVSGAVSGTHGDVLTPMP